MPKPVSVQGFGVCSTVEGIYTVNSCASEFGLSQSVRVTTAQPSDSPCRAPASSSVLRAHSPPAPPPAGRLDACTPGTQRSAYTQSAVRTVARRARRAGRVLARRHCACFETAPRRACSAEGASSADRGRPAGRPRSAQPAGCAVSASVLSRSLRGLQGPDPRGGALTRYTRRHERACGPLRAGGH